MKVIKEFNDYDLKFEMIWTADEYIPNGNYFLDVDLWDIARILDSFGRCFFNIRRNILIFLEESYESD